jgi:hypothetical protein
VFKADGEVEGLQTGEAVDDIVDFGFDLCRAVNEVDCG